MAKLKPSTSRTLTTQSSPSTATSIMKPTLTSAKGTALKMTPTLVSTKRTAASTTAKKTTTAMMRAKKKLMSGTKTKKKLMTSSKPTKKSTKQGQPQEIQLAEPRADGSYELDDWVPVQMGFGDLYSHLKPESSEVDRICKFLLDQNFPIRYLNVVFSRSGCYTLVKRAKEIKLKCPDFKSYRFVTGPNGDDPLIINRWEKLVTEANIQSPQDCYKKFSSSKSNRISIAKRNLLGCYLAQDLPHVRPGSSVFGHLEKFILEFETGKFTVEEDNLIIREVKKNGDCPETWEYLAKILKRKDRVIVQNRYLRSLKNPDLTTGRWSMTEEALFIEHFFSNKKDSSPQYIDSITFSNFLGVSELLNRSAFHVNVHWQGSLKPALLAYHGGCLLTNVKAQFLDYLVAKRVRALLDVDWPEATKMFPCETPISLKGFLVSEIRKFDRSYPSLINQPVHAKLLLTRNDWKDSQFPRKVISYREKIVELYLQARGVDQ